MSTVPYGWSENESSVSERSFAETPDEPNFKLVLKGRDLTEVGSTLLLCSHNLTQQMCLFFILIYTQHILIHVLVFNYQVQRSYFSNTSGDLYGWDTSFSSSIDESSSSIISPFESMGSSFDSENSNERDLTEAS